MPASDPEHEAQALRDHLADRDVQCPGCGYNLRGLRDSRCPECNQPLRLSVTLQDPSVGALLAAVIPAASVAGAAALLVCLVLTVVATRGKSMPRGDEGQMLFWIPLVVLVLLGVPALALVAPSGRAWFRRQTPGGRRRVVLAFWFASGLCFFGYIARLVHLM